MPWSQLPNISRGGIIYNHPTELMVGMRIFAMALCLIARAVDCANFRPIFCCGAGGASDDDGRVIFHVTKFVREVDKSIMQCIIVVGVYPMLYHIW